MPGAQGFRDRGHVGLYGSIEQNKSGGQIAHFHKNIPSLAPVIAASASAFSNASIAFSDDGDMRLGVVDIRSDAHDMASRNVAKLAIRDGACRGDPRFGF